MIMMMMMMRRREEEDDDKDIYKDDYDEDEENDDDDDDEGEEDDYSDEEEDDYSGEEEDDYSDEEEEEEDNDSDDDKDDDDEEVEALSDEKDVDDDEWEEREKGVKRKPDKIGFKEEEKENKDVVIREIDHVANTKDIVRRLETKVKTIKDSPRTPENNNRFLSQDGKMTVEKSTQTGNVNEERSRPDMQNALKCSKQMFQSNIFPKEKDKKRLLTKTLTIQTVNKWFINYRYHFFLHIKKHAADTITSKSTTVEINRLANKHYAKCFQCVSKKPKHHSKQQVKRAFMAWRYALQTQTAILKNT
ncbi:unnamed protein product [Mytilus coruscus]|uniref:Uncharacterized protein n=1 Tax=Mytilus coruscus TaxID=42192 RepID=A0A6J8CXJ9_MYTCO|nr:unnamed protein product [Mytilus coruscus]